MVGKDKVIHLDQYRQSQVFEEAEGSLDWFDEENANASAEFIFDGTVDAGLLSGWDLMEDLYDL